MKDKFYVTPDQQSQGNSLCIMMRDMVIARTPAATEVDRYMADYIVSALRLQDQMGFGGERIDDAKDED